MFYKHKDFYNSVDEIVKEKLKEGFSHREAIKQAIKICKAEYERISKTDLELGTAVLDYASAAPGSVTFVELMGKYGVGEESFLRYYNEIKDTLNADNKNAHQLLENAYAEYCNYIVGSIEELGKFDGSKMNSQNISEYMRKVRDVLAEAHLYSAKYYAREVAASIHTDARKEDSERVEAYKQLTALYKDMDDMPYCRVSDANKVIVAATNFLDKVNDMSNTPQGISKLLGEQ